MTTPAIESPAESQETRTERVGMALTPSEKIALGFLQKIWPDKYDGVSSVLRDFTPQQAVDLVARMRSVLLEAA